jgi:acrylyl-CoA reductase (NADPH)
MFRGIVVSKDDQGYSANLVQMDEDRLPEGDVTVQVEWSTVNYKDALAITGRSPVIRNFPMIPGIDLAGVVTKSDSAHWKQGDRVLLNGYGIGDSRWGGLAEKARVKGEWLIAVPERFSTRQAMAIGTAGYTAMLCIMALEKHGLKPEDGDILVTGASGGVGSVAISIFAKLGYRVIASTGRVSERGYLRMLGAADIMDRNELSTPGKPLDKERWAGVIDTAGSFTLANACAGTKHRGAVAACGLAQGMDFPATVAPFIIRGITLYGIDSAMAPHQLRLEAWNRLALDLDVSKLDAITSEIGLSEVIPACTALLEGKVRGRMVVNVTR